MGSYGFPWFPILFKMTIQVGYRPYLTNFHNGKALRDLQSRGAVGSEERSKWSQVVAEHQNFVIWHGPKTIKNQQPLGAMVKMLSYMD